MQRYFALKKIDNSFILSDSDIYHIKVVMRMNTNDLIEVVYDKTLYLCELIIDKDITINIKNELSKISEDINITLILPILKEQKMDLIIQKATELGVNKLIFINTERTIVKIDKNKIDNKLNRWIKIAKEASEQSKRYNIPIIEIRSGIKDLIGLKGLVCDTNSKEMIKTSLKTINKYDTINIVIGPEGGLSKNEIKYLNEIGFTSVSLGNRILRVETVPLYILSIINYELME